LLITTLRHRNFKVSSFFARVPCGSFDPLDMLTEAISFVTFIAQAVVFSTGDAVLSNISSLPVFKAQFAFATFSALSTGWISCLVIFDKVVQDVIGIRAAADNIFTSRNHNAGCNRWG